MNNAFKKAPNATLDYQIDWTHWLGADTIVASTWRVPLGSVQENATYTAKKATMWLTSGGRRDETPHYEHHHDRRRVCR